MFQCAYSSIEEKSSMQGNPLRVQESVGRMPTKIELTLEQSQQGVSNDVLTSHHRPSDAMHNPSQPFRWQYAPAFEY
nr:hypothetical protein [Tanacetum cinerariifolium]